MQPRRPRALGDLLREARERHGSDLESVAKALRIRLVYLAAIERGQYDGMPAPVYALGFVRAYAVHLGLDGEEAVRRFKLEAEGFDSQRDLSFPLPLAERSIPGGTMVLVALILAICGYGLWYYLSSGSRARPERVAAVPTRLVPPPADTTASAPPPTAAPASPVSASPSAPDPAGSAAPAPPAATTPAPTPPVTAAVSPPSPPAGGAGNVAPPEPPPSPPPVALAPPESAVPPPPAVPTTAVPGVPDAGAAPPADASRVFGVTSGPSRIVVRAVKDSWMQVSESDKSVLATRVLRAGDLYRVPDKPGLVMRTGNASGLEIIVDGHTVPSIGGTVRNVALDPARLQAGTATE